MPDLIPLLEAAAAHPDFKRDVLAFIQGEGAERIALEGYAPRVKVERVLAQLLRSHADVPIERVVVRGRSGCSDFVGDLTLVAGETEHRVHFTWCCAWRAEQEGWRDYYGFWDQARAAREYGWDCFQKWEMVA